MKIQAAIKKIEKEIPTTIELREIQLEFHYDYERSCNEIHCVVFYKKQDELRNFTVYSYCNSIDEICNNVKTELKLYKPTEFEL